MWKTWQTLIVFFISLFNTHNFHFGRIRNIIVYGKVELECPARPEQIPDLTEFTNIVKKNIVKLRERERHRVDQGKKKKKNGWWMVDILYLMLYTKFGWPTFHHHHPPVLLLISRIKLFVGQVR